MADTTDVAKFEPLNFVEKLKDKIKQSMIDIIPEEQWEAMLKKEIDSFFNDKTEGANNWSQGRLVPSEFKQSVRSILHDEIQKKVKEMLSSDKWTNYWNGMENMTGEALAEFVQQNGALILNNWLVGSISSVLDRLKHESRTY